jgi:hypothetical protein
MSSNSAAAEALTSVLIGICPQHVEIVDYH